MTGPVKVLLVSVSVVALPTRVSVATGSVKVPVFDMELIIGVVRVLFVSVSVVALPTSVSVEVGSVRVPVFVIELITGVVKVLLVNVCVSTVVTSVFVAGIVVPFIVDVAVIAPVTARVPLSVELPVTPSVPPMVALPVIGKLDAVPALIKSDGDTFFRDVAEASYISSKSLV
jgi:hypothetical protein